MANLKKIRLNPVLARSLGILIASAGMIILFYQCSGDEENPPDINTRGTDNYDMTNVTPVDYLEGLISATSNGEIFAAYGLIPAEQWFLDVPHSAVNWETAYMGSQALLTGKFSWFSLDYLTFDETKPSNIAFEGKVLLNSVVTGQPLRDEGCLLTTYVTSADKKFETENIATIKTTGAVYNTEDDGYTVTADLTFLGDTREVTINMYYLGLTSFETNKIVSFQAEFSFNAISDFKLASTSVADKVTVKMNINIKKNNG